MASILSRLQYVDVKLTLPLGAYDPSSNCKGPQRNRKMTTDSHIPIDALILTYFVGVYAFLYVSSNNMKLLHPVVLNVL